MSLEIISNNEEWTKRIILSKERDFYFSFDYHLISKSESEVPLLLVYDEGEGGILLPILVRNIPDTEYKDATSVYGYSGPLTFGKVTPNLIAEFQKELLNFFQQQGIISVFSRLHPYIPGQIDILKGIGTIESSGKVVNINLLLNEEKQWSQVSRRYRSYINKARKTYTVRPAETEVDLDRFIELYQLTMKRLGAHPRYFFNNKYYHQLRNSKQFETRILLAEDRESGKIVSAAMFIVCCSIVQYHLSGTDAAYIDLHPVKLLIDEMRLRATREGKKYFNLGGGIGGHEDSLFEFKSRFSKDYREFFIWKYIADQDRYQQLSEAHIRKVCNKDPMHCKEFFPCYRCDARIPQPPEGHGGAQ